MKILCAAVAILGVVFRGDLALAKETCVHAWGKGSYKSHQQIERELHRWLVNGKILTYSLCGSGNEHYFHVTILEGGGKVRVLRVPAR